METPRKFSKVAIVHDWLITYRGGEKMLEALCELYPNADIYTLFYQPGKLGKLIESKNITASPLNRLPGVRRYYRHLLPFLPSTIESFDLSAYDLVISSSHCVAKGVITSPDTLHVCYCYTPMRYVWDQYRQYFGKSRLEPLARLFAHYLRMWDVSSSARVDQFIGISKFISKRIRKYYGREAEVVYPFADLEFYQPSTQSKDDFYLAVSAMAPYKRIDLAIQACQELDRKLIVVGDGQVRKKLAALGGKNIEFIGQASDEQLRDLYQRAKALIFPGLEDFGIVPVEAMACGTPVIAYGAGGAAETVKEGTTGLFFEEQTVASLKEAIIDFERLKWNKQVCHHHAQTFSKEHFKRGICRAINNAYTKPAAGSQVEPSPQLPLDA